MGDRFYGQQGRGGFKSAAQRRGFMGVTPLRKKLRRLDKVITRGIAEEVEKMAKAVQADAIGWAYLQDIKDSGDMIASISYKLGRDGLTATVGPGADKGAWQGVAFDTGSIRFAKLSINQKDARWQFIKGYWAEFGTQGPVPQKPRSFMNKAWDENKESFMPKIDKKIARALEFAADFYN